jgi:PAS domain S-box-containing protein
VTYVEPPLNVLDSIHEGCQVIGPGYTYLYLNEAAARQGRQPRDRLLGRTMMECYPGIENTPMFALLKSCMDEGTTHHFENEFTYPDGRKGWFDLRLQPVPSGVFVLSLDITERKLAEQERQRLATAMNQAAEAVMITDGDGIIEYVNPAFEEISGYGREEVIGRTPNILSSGKQGQSFYAEMWDTIRSGRTWRGRIVNRHKNGALFTEEAAISPVFGESGTITHFVSVKRDVTRELLLEEQFRQAQKMEAVGQLAGGVAHDFNNLLALILGYTDLLLEGVPENDSRRADILEVRKAGERAAALTRQLLAFSRKQVMRNERINLSAVAAGMEEMLRRLIGSDVELAFVLRPDTAMVIGDAGQIEQVIMNLVLNARDAMPRGGRITIETANVDLDREYVATHLTARVGPHVMLSVADNGEGMSAEVKARVFEAFFTTKEQGRGTGLGLATVYGIVKQSGGNIWVYSEPRLGTTFKIYFPVVAGGQRAPTPPALTRARVAKGEAILVVENEESVRNLTRRLLGTEGYAVFTAANADEAMSICRAHGNRLTLLLTDIVMPKVGGVQLAAMVRKTLPDLPILFMSGYAEAAVNAFDDLGESPAFITKPFTASQLCQKVREVIGEPHRG